MLTGIQAQSSITPEIATMISVGAQAQGEAVGVEATSFSRLSEGLKDRIYPTKGIGEKGKQGDIKQEQIETKFSNAVNSYGEIIRNQIPVRGDYYGPVSLQTTDKADIENIAVELYKSALAKFTESGQTSTAFIPIKLDFSLYGMSGMKIFQKFKLSNDVLPLSYKGNFEFIVTGLSHTVDNSKWETSVSSLISLKDKEIDKSKTVQIPIAIALPELNTTGKKGEPIGKRGITHGKPFQSSASGYVSYSSDISKAKRNQPLQDKLFDIIEKSAKEHKLYVEIFSAGQDFGPRYWNGKKYASFKFPRRTGSHRHDNGFAADIRLRKTINGAKLNTNNPEQIVKDFAESLYKNGMHSIGAGNGYMNNNALHVDIAWGQVTPENGQSVLPDETPVPKTRLFGSGAAVTSGAATWLQKVYEKIKDKYPVQL